jgi:integrase
MATTITVSLASNGDYWTAVYKDPATGKRRKKGLGPKSELSKRQARKRCQTLANELSRNPSLAAKAPALGAFIDRYVAGRTDLKKSTRYLYRLAGRYLTSYFSEEVRIDCITRARARDWRTAMRAGEIKLLVPTDDGKGTVDRSRGAMAETTVCDTCKYAKAMFRQAVDDDLILFNPFDRLRSTAPDPVRDWHYVPLADFEKLIDACTGHGWKSMIALCRLAGLRRGEAASLPWSAIDWERRRLTVYAEKTATTDGEQGKRIVPIEPRLYDILLAAFSQAKAGQQTVCDLSANNLRRDFAVIRKRAGLAEWAEPFQVMRRNRETDWAQVHPQHAVSEWLGHDITVSARFYLRVPEALYEKVAGIAPPAAPQNGSAAVAPQNAPQTTPSA